MLILLFSSLLHFFCLNLDVLLLPLRPLHLPGCNNKNCSRRSGFAEAESAAEKEAVAASEKALQDAEDRAKEKTSLAESLRFAEDEEAKKEAAESKVVAGLDAKVEEESVVLEKAKAVSLFLRLP